MDSKKEKKIGVFICHCGKNIAGGLDIGALVEHAKKIEGVVYVENSKFCCSEDGQKAVQEAIKAQKLDRVVVAACDPALHLLTFQRCGEKAGIEPQFVDLIDIRKWTMHGSPHKLSPEQALENSEKLVELAVKRMRLKRLIPMVEVKAEQSILVIGGGVAGLEAGLDLADKGYQVHIVERLPTIGGKMALLYKVYPTNDCAPCILAPKTAYANIHPNINLLTNSEVKGVEGYIGKFNVEVIQRPRYIDSNKCTGCGECVEKCPVKVVDSEYSGGLGQRKAIYIPYDQAIPKKAVIDSQNCLYFRKDVCRICEKACPTAAIDFKQQTQTINLKVGAIIVATGFDEYNPVSKSEYGYGRYGNVITQFQLARLLDIDGPTAGKLLRPFDSVEPKRIVMVQCVGSRDENTNDYCSNICCMYALKHAQIIKEMVLPDAEIYICFIDMRTVGKDFEKYYRRTRELGVHFIRGRPSEIVEEPDTKNLLLRVEDPDINQLLEIEANLVVLSCATIPSQGSRQLSQILGVELDANGFFKEIHPKLRPVETNVRGIYICGAAQGPKDIPDSIVQAKAAASFADGELRKSSIKLPEFMVKASQVKQGG
ncbi:MAG: CoB--CoM heterodisulfide reductase iron-sulfur subunit A family protein [Candidatus Aminicenantes bacterium]|nr:CoB--CoM heterodisulfide reductase iron-sulfur subunit A family protein [Candidatus Aminicenantes bacterium]